MTHLNIRFVCAVSKLGNVSDLLRCHFTRNERFADLEYTVRHMRSAVQKDTIFEQEVKRVEKVSSLVGLVIHKIVFSAFMVILATILLEKRIFAISVRTSYLEFSLVIF